MIKTSVRKYTLTAEAIDAIAEVVTTFCTDMGTERKEMLKCRLSIEECLLYWLNNGLENNTVELKTGRYLLIPYIQIEVKGESQNPYTRAEDDFGLYAQSILVRLGLDPEYSYDNGRNRVKYKLKKKAPGMIATLCMVIISALVIGFLGMAVIPDPIRAGLQESLLTPLYNTFFNILGCLAGPMIFLSVAWGVYGIGDAATLGKIGKKMMIRYVGIVLLTTTCGVLTFPLLGPPLSSGTFGKTQLSSISELILGIVPSTIVEPFATGNTLQIIFMAIVIGIALLYLGRQTGGIALAIEQVNILVQFLMEVISRLVPYVIFLVILNMMWSGDLKVFLSVWKLALVTILAFVLAAFMFINVTAFRLKVSPMKLARKNLPTFLVALTTASSAASFNSHVLTCENEYGIDPSLIRFGIPLGMVMHKPIAAIYNLMVAFFFADRFGIECSVSWICVAVFICAIISIATPPIPGGGAIAYSILFLQLGIPKDAMAVALAIDVIADFFITSFEMMVLPMSLLQIASKLGMIDKAVLRQ